MIYTLLHHQRRVQSRDKWGYHREMKGPRLSYYTKESLFHDENRLNLLIWQKEEPEHMWRREMLCFLSDKDKDKSGRHWRTGDWAYWLHDTRQHTGQKLHHRLPDNIKPLTEHVLSYGRIWDCFWQRCGACACPGLVELKRKTMIIQVFQEAVQHFSCLFLVFSNAKVLLGFATVRTVEDKVSINTPLNFGTRPQCGIVRETSASIRALPQ